MTPENEADSLDMVDPELTEDEASEEGGEEE